MKTMAWAITALLSFPAAEAAAQAAPPSLPRREAALRDPKIGQRIRVLTRDAARMEGVLSGIGDGRVELWLDRGETRLPTVEIDYVWVRGNS